MKVQIMWSGKRFGFHLTDVPLSLALDKYEALYASLLCLRAGPWRRADGQSVSYEHLIDKETFVTSQQLTGQASRTRHSSIRVFSDELHFIWTFYDILPTP